MKATIFALILSAATIASASAELLKALPGHALEVRKAVLVKGDEGKFQVYAQVLVGNDCMAPDHYVATVTNGADGRMDILLGGVNNQERVCAQVYEPVLKTVLTHTLYTEGMPVFVTVNGHVAALKH